LGTNILQFALQDIFGWYFTESDILFTDPTLVEIQAANAMGQSPIYIPTYMYKGVLDEISPVADTDALYDYYCSSADGSASIEYVRDTSAEHAQMILTAIPSVVQWLKGRFDGEAAIVGCQSTDVVSIIVDGVARQLLGDAIVDALEGLLVLV
jgi:hypothetical protein